VPAFEAIDMGHPERMGIRHGWDEARFIEASRTTLPDGRPYENLCIGCDRFHEQVLGPVLAQARAQRFADRGLALPAAAPGSSAGTAAPEGAHIPITTMAQARHE
jgi:hypothetical protein